MALFNIKFKDLEQGFQSLVGNVGNVVRGVTNPIQGLNMLGQGIRNVINQPQQPPRPVIQQPTQPTFDFRSTFKQPGVPSPQPTLQQPTAAPLRFENIVNQIKTTAPTVQLRPEQQLPNEISRILGRELTPTEQFGISTINPLTPFGKSTFGKITREGISSGMQGDYIGMGKAAQAATKEATAQALFGTPTMGVTRFREAVARIQNKPFDFQKEYEKDMAIGRAIEPQSRAQGATLYATEKLSEGAGTIAAAAGNKELAQYLDAQAKDIQQFNKDITPPVYDENSVQQKIADTLSSTVESMLISSIPAVGPVLFGATEFGRVSKELRDEGVAPGNAAIAGAIYAPVAAIFERFGSKGIVKGFSGGLKKAIVNFVSGYAKEGSTEGLQQLTENIVKKIAGGKIDSVWQGVPESFAIGGLFGGSVEVATGAIRTDSNADYIDKAVDSIANDIEAKAKTAGVDVATYIATYGPQLTTAAQAAPGLPVGGLPPGIVASVGGPQAAGFKEAEQKGIVYIGPDNKKRFEFSDSKAKIDFKNLSKEGIYKYSDLIDHPVLYKQYPELANTRVEILPISKLNGAVGAAYERDGKFVIEMAKLNPYLPPSEKIKQTEEILKTLLHENQHIIQKIEGYASGSNQYRAQQMSDFTEDIIAKKMFPEAYKENPYGAKYLVRAFAENRPNRDKYNQWLKDYKNTYGKKPKEKVGIDKIQEIYGPEMSRNLARYVFRIAHLDWGSSKYSKMLLWKRDQVNRTLKNLEFYLMTLGEWEARQVERRKNMTQAQLDALGSDFRKRFAKTTDMNTAYFIQLSQDITAEDSIIEAADKELTNLKDLVEKYFAPRPGQEYKGEMTELYKEAYRIYNREKKALNEAKKARNERLSEYQKLTKEQIVKSDEPTALTTTQQAVVKPVAKPGERQEPISYQDLKQQNKQQIQEQKDRYKKISWWRRFQRAFIDPFALATELDRATGVTKKADSLEAALDVAAGNPDLRLDNRLKQFGVRGGKDALFLKYPDGTAAAEDFHLYRILKFQQELNTINRKQIIRDNDGLSLQPYAVDSMVKELETQYPGIKQDVLKLKALFDNIMVEAERVGLLEKGTQQATSSKYKYWSNIDRVFPDYVLKPGIDMRAVGAVAKQKVVQELTGGEAPVGTDWESTIDRLRATERQIGLQKAGSILLKQINKLQQMDKKVRGKMMGEVIQSKEDVLQLRSLKTTLSEIMNLRQKLETQRRRARENARVMRVAAAGTQQVLKTKVAAKERAAKLELNRAIKNFEMQSRKKLREFFPKELHGVINGLTLEELVAIADDATTFETQAKFVTPESDVTGVTPPSAGVQAAKKGVESALLKYKAGPTGVNKTIELLARRSQAHADFVNKWQQIRAGLFALKENSKELRTIISDVRTDPTTGKQIITVLDEGIPTKIEVQPELAQMILGFNEEKLGTFFKAMRYTQMPFRWVFTGFLNPQFMITSTILYDTPMSVINSEQGLKTLGPKAMMAGIKSLASSSQFQQALRDGGAQMSTSSLGGSEVQIDPKFEGAKRNLFRLAKYSVTTKKGLKNVMDTLDVMGGKLANSTRSRIAAAAYFAAKQKGYSDTDAMAEAVYAYNNVMPNYARSSSALKKVDAFFMYTAAGVAGTRAYGKAVKQRPVKTLAYTAAFTMPVLAVVAASIANMGAGADDEEQNYYKDMIASKKEYILDDNLVLQLPGAKKDKSGQWSGIVRIPVAPELRGINKMLWRTAYQNITGQNVATPGAYATAIVNTMTGGVFDRPDVPGITTLLSLMLDKDIRIGQGTAYDITPPDLKFIEDKNEIYKEKTSETAKNIARGINQLSGQKNGIVTPLQVEYLLNKGGLLGDIVQEPSDIFGQVVKRFQGTTGRTAGAKYYAALEEDKKSISDWNQNDESAYISLHPRKKDSRGQDIWDDSVNVYNAKARDEIYNRYPNVLELDRKQNARNAKEGKPSNPLMELPNDQLRKVLAKEAMIPGQKDPELDILYRQEWYVNYRSDKKNFFDTLKQLAAKEGWSFAPSDNPYPETPPALQAAMNEYNKLKKGTGARSAWIRSNPQVFEAMKAQWAAIDDWQNRQRAKFGLAATEGAAGIAGGFKEPFESYGGRGYTPRIYQPRYPSFARKPGRLMSVGAPRTVTIRRPGKIVVKRERA